MKTAIKLLFRLAVVAAVLLTTMIFVVLPASATANIDQVRSPNPGDPSSYILNDGTGIEHFWWQVTFDSQPARIRHYINGPGLGGPIIHDESWDVTGRATPVKNPEYTDPGWNPVAPPPLQAHNITQPAGSAPGQYFSTVEYYRFDQTLGELFEASARVDYLVKQRVEVLKYNDVNGNGSQGSGETGLSGWSISVNGPGTLDDWSGTTDSNGLLVDTSTGLNYRDVYTAGAFTAIETLQPGGWMNTDPTDHSLQKTFNVPSIGLIAAKLGNHLPTPGTYVDIRATPGILTTENGTVTLTVSEQNTGEYDLSNVYVDVTGGATYHLTKGGPNPPGTIFSGDTVNDNKLNGSLPGPAETWTWTIPNVPVNGVTTFTAIGYGEYGSNPVSTVTYPQYGDERHQVTVGVTPPNDVPGFSTPTMVVLIMALGGLMTFFMYRKLRRSQR
jgi:hypothetical protein